MHRWLVVVNLKEHEWWGQFSLFVHLFVTSRRKSKLTAPYASLGLSHSHPSLTFPCSGAAPGLPISLQRISTLWCASILTRPLHGLISSFPHKTLAEDYTVMITVLSIVVKERCNVLRSAGSEPAPLLLKMSAMLYSKYIHVFWENLLWILNLEKQSHTAPFKGKLNLCVTRRPLLFVLNPPMMSKLYVST